MFHTTKVANNSNKGNELSLFRQTNNDNTEGLIAEDDIYMLTDKCCEISEVIVQMRMPLTMANMAESEFKVM